MLTRTTLTGTEIWDDEAGEWMSLPHTLRRAPGATEQVLMAEVAAAIARLTQVVAGSAPAAKPRDTTQIDSGTFDVWADTKDAQVLSQRDDSGVFVRGRLTSSHAFESDLYCLHASEAILLGQALINAGMAATTGNVVPIETNTPGR